MAITGIPDQIKIQNSQFSETLLDDEGIMCIIKCHAPKGYLSVTDVLWDPAVTVAASAVTLSIDVGTQVDTDTDIIAAGDGIIIPLDAETVTHVADHINASDYWECTVLCHPTTVWQEATATLRCLAITGASANGRGCATEVGTKVYFDVSVAFEMQCAVGLELGGIGWGAFSARHSARNVRDASTDTATEQKNPARALQGLDRVNWVSNITSKATFGSGTNTINLYAVNRYNVVRTLYSLAGGATTVEQALDWAAAVKYGLPGERLVVQITGAAVSPVTYLNIEGGWGLWKY